MNRRRHSFACVCLGMIAMLGAVVSFPLSAAHALAMIAAPASGPMMSHGDMTRSGPSQAGQTLAGMAHEDCHKPCPNCPQNSCPDVGACLSKCFQPMAQPVAVVAISAAATPLHVTHRSSLVAAGAVVSPLLRPPKA